jgi:hypothetical protein
MVSDIWEKFTFLLHNYAPLQRREGILLSCGLSVGPINFRSFSSCTLAAHIELYIVYRFEYNRAIFDRVMALGL